MESVDRTVGRTSAGSDILLQSFGNGKLSVILLGGVHGDESEGFLFAERFVDELHQGNITLSPDITLHIIARMNPDGCNHLRRTNHHNVDLNRNLPTADWTGEFTNVRYYPGSSPGSEMESLLTVRLIEEWNPSVIFSLHSYEHPMINFNGECEDLAKAMSEKNNLPPKGDIGYPTPGSLGTYAGWERNLPTITLEFLRDQQPEDVWNQNLDAVLTGFHYYLDHPLPERKLPQ